MKPDPERSPSEQVMKIVIVGHVDHGKSTLVGRLLHDTGSLPDGKFDAIKEMCARRGVDFKWSFLMDALQRERDDGITVDTAQIRFRTARRGYVIIDAPGHKEFLKNMITGAASSDAALLLIDADEGIREQTRRHVYLLHLLGVRQVVVGINKMDLVGFDRSRFDEIAHGIRSYMSGLGLEPSFVVPISAREGDNVAASSSDLGWFAGPTIADALDMLDTPPSRTELPIRLPVQDVYDLDKRRVIVGRLESGRLAAGDVVALLPSGSTARIASIERWRPAANPAPEVVAGESIGLTFDKEVSVRRGEVLADHGAPPEFTDTIRARVFWLGQRPVSAGDRYQLRLNTARYDVEVLAVDRVIDVGTLEMRRSRRVGTNDVAEITFKADTPLVLDAFSTNPRMGRFVLQDGHDIVGGGIISVPPSDTVDEEPDDAAAGQILWMTGLSGAGKTTLAASLSKRLRRAGHRAVVLDGDALRTGINSDLGFSPEDRSENVRRTGEVAALFSDAGLIVIVAQISPYQVDRDRARSLRPERFHEIHVAADLETCEARDPKGLYRKARDGTIPEFSGVSAPYEPPAAPELVVDTAATTPDRCVDRILDHLNGRAQAGKYQSNGYARPA